MQGGDAEIGLKIELVEEEFVGVLDFETHRFKHLDREVPQVRGHDDVRPSPQRGGHHVPVVRIWQGQTGRQVPPTRHAGVLERRADHVRHPPRCTRRQIRMDRLNGVHHLVQDAFAPHRSVQVSLRRPKQGVGQYDRHQDAGVGERAEPGPPVSLPDACGPSEAPRCSREPTRRAQPLQPVPSARRELPGVRRACDAGSRGRRSAAPDDAGRLRAVRRRSRPGRAASPGWAG